LRRALDEEHLTQSARARYNVELVFEEIIGNILRYGAPRGHELHVEAQIHRDGESILVTIEDDGIPFDPCSSADSTLPRTLEEDRDGGFGLMIVRHASRAMHYERTGDARNRLTVTLSALD
jgi:serine/threonine-protein kinase RsbW